MRIVSVICDAISFWCAFQKILQYTTLLVIELFNVCAHAKYFFFKCLFSRYTVESYVYLSLILLRTWIRLTDLSDSGGLHVYFAFILVAVGQMQV